MVQQVHIAFIRRRAMNRQRTQQTASSRLENRYDFLNIEPHATPVFWHRRRPKLRCFRLGAQILQQLDAQDLARSQQFGFPAG